MNAGNICTSERLKSTLEALLDGQPHSTWEIGTVTRSCAVHSDIAALRHNGFEIETKRHAKENGCVRFTYRLVNPPTPSEFGQIVSGG